MHQQASLLFYKFHLLFVGIVAIAFLITISAVVTSVGSHSVLDARSSTSANALTASEYDSPNAVTAGGYVLMDGTRHILLVAGIGFYGSCRSLTNVTAQTGTAVLHGSADLLGGIWNGTRFAGRGFGDSTMLALHTLGGGMLFAVRLPGKAVGSLTNTHAVADIIRPADNTDQVPTIGAESSAEILAHITAQSEQEIQAQEKANALLAAQLAANRALDGTIVAGDPAHGGYPTKWDDGRQDSMVDSWGMYNRECVSYAAWKVYQAYGDMPNWGGVGNANEWPGDARRAGIPTGSTPKIHSVAISMRGYYGHAMWVEAVDGDMIYVSQYNYDLHGHYSEMWVNGSNFTYLYFK